MLPQTIQMRQSQQVKQVGSYIFATDDLIGEGNQAKVYKGKHLQKNYEVAIKVINTENMGMGVQRKLLDSQIKVLETLRDRPYILNLHEVIRTIDQIYIVTELCYGDLSQRSSTKIPQIQAWKYLSQIVQGYKQLHRYNIIHRDLKPANLLLNAKKQIKIADFGFATSQSEAKKQSHYNIGSPQYMSPQALTKNHYSCNSDIWAIGMIFYQLLTGQRPWKNKKQAFIQSRLTQNFIHRLLKNQSFSPKALDILSSCLKFDPTQRIDPQQLFLYDFHVCQQLPLKINKSQTLIKNNVNESPEEKAILLETMTPLRKRSSLKKATEKRVFINKQVNIEQQFKRNKNPIQLLQKPTINQIANISENLLFRINLCQALFSILSKISFIYERKSFLKKSCFEELTMLSICYSNIIIKMILKIIDLEESNLLLVPKNHLLNYIKTVEYEEILKKCQELMNIYSISAELREQWPRAKDQNIMGAINATKNVIKKISEEIKFFNYEEIALTKLFVNILPLLESLHEERIDKENLEVFLSNGKSHQNFTQLMERAKSLFSKYENA